MGGDRELVEQFITSLEARDWEAWAGLLDPDVVYEIPQSRERIRGRDRYLQFNQEYPGDWHLRPKVIIADEQHGVVWFEWHLGDRAGDGADDGMVFFELRQDSQFDATAFERINSCIQYRGFLGGVVLRGEGHAGQFSARISLLRSETPIEGTIGPGKKSLLKGSAMAKSLEVSESLHFGSMLIWAESAFSQFAFDLIAMMQGTYRSGFLSSFYGMGSSRVEQDF